MEMYHERPRGDETYAFLVWGVEMFCLYIAGKFADNSLVYWCTGVIAPGLAILISLKHDHSLKELGLYPNHLKRDSAVMLCAFAAELLIGVYIYGMSLEYALPAIAYYIVWIAVPEEILFRGLIQSHLFRFPSTENSSTAWAPPCSRHRIFPIKCRSGHGMRCLPYSLV